MRRSVKWVVGAIAVTLVAAFAITYIIVGRFIDDCWEGDWELDEE